MGEGGGGKLFIGKRPEVRVKFPLQTGWPNQGSGFLHVQTLYMSARYNYLSQSKETKHTYLHILYLV